MGFYRKTWYKKWQNSLLSYLRDLIVNFLPIRKLPGFITKFCYGIKPKFVFLIHARRSQDIFVGVPFLTILRQFLPKKVVMKLISKLPPFVVDIIKTPKSVNGLVVGKLILPEVLLTDRRTALKEARKTINFSCKISEANSTIGLGALWPMATRRGLAIKNYTEKRGSTVTTGHCLTILSIFLTIKKICNLCKMPVKEVKIVVIGAGKVGSQIAKVFHGKVHTISLVDINRIKLLRLQNEFNKIASFTKINIFIKDNSFSLKNILEKHHIAICATSSARQIAKPEDIPNNFIIIDDSRPEAISRDLGCDDKIVLEGGVLRVKNIQSNYNYGFGINENVFGCLAEAYILSLDDNRRLKPNIGNIDMDNFYEMMEYCYKNEISVGDFISRDLIIPDELLTKVMKKRTQQLKKQKSKDNK